MPTIAKECPICGRTFEDFPSRMKKRVTCAARECLSEIRRRRLLENPMRGFETPHVRFLAKLGRLEEQFGRDACWPYPGKLGKKGYCKVSTKLPSGHRVSINVHRLAYILLRGPIPDDFDADHKCRNRRCCNPLHIEPETRQTNVLLGDGLAAQNARKTHCPKGHPYNEQNTAIYAGSRVCRKCRVEHQKAYLSRNRAAVNAYRRKHRREAKQQLLFDLTGSSI